MDANFLRFGFKSIGEVGEPELLASVPTWPISWSRHYVDPEDIDFAAYVLWVLQIPCWPFDPVTYTYENVGNSFMSSSSLLSIVNYGVVTDVS